MSPARRNDIAHVAREAYPAPMALRLFRFLVMLAVLTMPLRMTGHAAAAMDHGAPAATSAAGHCADHQAPDDQRSQVPVDCMIACAALPAASQCFEEPAEPTSIPAAALAASTEGIGSGADPPPPRRS